MTHRGRAELAKIGAMGQALRVYTFAYGLSELKNREIHGLPPRLQNLFNTPVRSEK